MIQGWQQCDRCCSGIDAYHVGSDRAGGFGVVYFEPVLLCNTCLVDLDIWWAKGKDQKPEGITGL